MRDPERLNALDTNMEAVEAACRRIGSTGLYPYAVLDKEHAFSRRVSFLDHPATRKTLLPALRRPRWPSGSCMTRSLAPTTASFVFSRDEPWSVFQRSG
jgi:hypothetical protein